MARTKRYRRYYRKKTSWCSNIQEIEQDNVSNSADWQGNAVTLVSNPIQQPTTVSQIYTVKNVEASFVVEAPSQQQYIEDFTVYLMYVPQGMELTKNYNNQHPEYVMAYKYYGSPANDSNQAYQPMKIKSRLSRKLNTGDQIILFLKYQTQVNDTMHVYLRGVVRWWTKAN